MKRSSWGADLLDLLLPSGCIACGAWIPVRWAAALMCGPCRSRLLAAPWPRCPRCHVPLGAGRTAASDCFECRAWPVELSAARYAWVLARPADDLVHALKYEGWPELASLMAADMARVVDQHHAPEGRVVVPTPTTPRRLRSRGYNQAELLARCVSERLGLDLRHALVRTQEARSQTTLTPSERQRNVRGAFAPARGEEAGVRGAHVLLVDDVLTTGATAGEAAMVLTRMGARSVTLLAFARALPSTVQRAA